MSLQSMPVLLVLVFATVIQAGGQGERATLPLTLQPRPLQVGCPSQDEISEIHDKVRSVLQNTVEAIRRQAAQDLNGTNSSDSTHCWVDHSNGDTQHCFSEEQWNKLQDDIKEGLYTELQGELLIKIQEMLQNEITQVQESLHQIQSDLNQTEIEHSGDIKQLEKLINQLLQSSCKQLTERNPSLPSGYYWINTTTQVYCDMDREASCINGTGTGGWTRVVYLNMTDPTHQCPSAWREITSPIRTCGRSTNAGCDSVIFSTNGIQYRNVLGRVVGYQVGSPDAFVDGSSQTIDGNYLDGMTITHGMPRDHIWSFASEVTDNARCPCSTTYTAPSFVGEDYFCESATVTYQGKIFYENDPLWDGQGCGTNTTCCTYNNPPWFCKQLPQATIDDIEIRLCATSGTVTSEDTPIELIEIFIQ